MKDLQAAVQSAIAADAKKVRLLYEIALTGATLRYCSGVQDLVFPAGGGTVYSAKQIIAGDIETSAEGQIGRITLQISNITRDMAALVNAYRWAGGALAVKRIFLDAANDPPADAADYVEVFTGTLQQPENITRPWLKVPATAGLPLDRKTLLKRYTRVCMHSFGDPDTCNTDGNADLATLTVNATATGGSTTGLIDTANLTQADGFWNFGKVKVTVSGTTYIRQVKNSIQSSKELEFDVALPVACGSGDSYQVWKGCDKTWTTCGGGNAWGPTTDNQDNFLGFLHIGHKRTNN